MPWQCRIFGWHRAPTKQTFDGCSYGGNCPRCGAAVLCDSQGNWFTAESKQAEIERLKKLYVEPAEAQFQRSIEQAERHRKIGDRIRAQESMMTFTALLSEDIDEDVCQYTFHGQGRLVLDTIHGRICIDIRAEDVNAFTVLPPFGRRDSLIIPSFRPTTCVTCQGRRWIMKNDSNVGSGGSANVACPDCSNSGVR